MGEEKETQPQFLEITCKSTGRSRRFAAGTEAGFALCMINRKLGNGMPVASHIEAIKEDEEPISFGPNAILVNYGKDWKLQTVTIDEVEEAKKMKKVSKQSIVGMKSLGSQSTMRSNMSIQYFLKIIAAFAFIFIFGGTLALLLENLPKMLLVTPSLKALLSTVRSLGQTAVPAPFLPDFSR